MGTFDDMVHLQVSFNFMSTDYFLNLIININNTVYLWCFHIVTLINIKSCFLTLKQIVLLNVNDKSGVKSRHMKSIIT